MQLLITHWIYYCHCKYLHNTFPGSYLGHRLGEGGCLLGGADGGEPLLRRALGGEVEVEAVAGDQPQRGQGHAPPQQAQPPKHHILLIDSAIFLSVYLPGAGLSIKTSLEVLHAVQGDEVNQTEDEDNLGARLDVDP